MSSRTATQKCHWTPAWTKAMKFCHLEHFSSCDYNSWLVWSRLKANPAQLLISFALQILSE